MKHRGRVSEFAHVPSHYPQIDGGLAIYVIEFTNGIVKVGLTYDPLRRAQQLSLTASRVGVKVSRIYVSGALRAKSAAETEKALIERVGRFANPFRRSTGFFSHTRFGAVAALARQLVSRADPHERVDKMRADPAKATA